MLIKTIFLQETAPQIRSCYYTLASQSKVLTNKNLNITLHTLRYNIWVKMIYNRVKCCNFSTILRPLELQVMFNKSRTL